MEPGRLSHKGTVAQKMCDMPHAILLLEGTLRTLCTMLLVLRAHVLPYCIARVRGMSDAAVAPAVPRRSKYNYATAGAASAAVTAGTAEARKMDNVLSVPSRRRMDSDMSHLILKDGATFSYIWY